MKRCPRCKQTKSYDQWHKTRTNYDGYASYCKLCCSIRAKIYRAKPEWREHKRIYERKYIQRSYVKKLRAEYALKYYYGITGEVKQQLWLSQEKKCAICKQELMDQKEICVDHDHITKKVRGILCKRCNRMLGAIKDNIETLQSAINYLNSHLTIPL